MSEVRLSAETRTEFGKGGARRTRRAGKIPAVIYGHGADPRHVVAAGARVHQRDPARRHQRAADPRRRRRRAARHPEGDPAPPDQGLLRARRPAGGAPRREGHHRRPAHVVGDIVAGRPARTRRTPRSASRPRPPTSRPSFEVNIDGLAIGSQITAGDLTLPERLDAGHRRRACVLVIITEAPTEAELEADDAPRPPRSSASSRTRRTPPRASRPSAAPPSRRPSSRAAAGARHGRRPVPGRRARQSRAAVRRHPAQRRLLRRSTCSPSGSAAVQGAQGPRRRRRGSAGRRAGRAGQAAGRT